MLSSKTINSAADIDESKRKPSESADERVPETKRHTFDSAGKMPYMDASQEDSSNDIKRQQAFETTAKAPQTEVVSTAEPITITMECPATAVGSIIGKKGANVNEINSRSGCKVVIDQREGIPARVNLTGPPDRLAIAMSLVSLIIKDGANALFGGDTDDAAGSKTGLNLTSESRCATVKVGTIIGHKGVTIAEIARRSKCKVHIIQDPPSDGNLNERQVIYSGTLEQIQEAKILVQSVIDEGASALGLPSLPPSDGANAYSKNQPQYPLKNNSPVIVEEEDIDPDKVKNVIGAKGCIISEIMRRSGCKIIIDQQHKEQTHKVVYTGQKDQIDAARALVDLVITKGPASLADPYAMNNTVTVEDMDIYQKHTGRVLGPLGSTIKEIQARFGVKMNIHVSDSAKGGDETALNKLRVTGSFDGVRGAKQFVCYILNGGVMERFVGMSPGPSAMFNQPPGMLGHHHQQYPYGKSPINSRAAGLGAGYYQSQNINFAPPRNKFSHHK